MKEPKSTYQTPSPQIAAYSDGSSRTGTAYIVTGPDGATTVFQTRQLAVSEAAYVYAVDSADVVVNYHETEVLHVDEHHDRPARAAGTEEGVQPEP